MRNIEISENQSGGEFIIRESGNRLAEMAYTNADADKIIIAHTFVEDIYRGEHLGKDLVNAGVEFAREKGLKIIPLCPFAKAEFERHAEYTDVLAD